MCLPLFGALDALAVHDSGGGAGVASLQFANLLVELEMQPVEHAIAVPAHEPAVHRAARWQVLGQGSPLAAGAQDIEYRVEDLAHPLRVGARFGGAEKMWLDQIPFGVREVTRVAQTCASVATSVLWGPHRRLRESAPASESQVTARILIPLGPALNFSG